jgi:hypothetical protein
MIYGLKLLPNKIPIPYTKILPRQANKNAGIQTMAKYQVSFALKNSADAYTYINIID